MAGLLNFTLDTTVLDELTAEAQARVTALEVEVRRGLQGANERADELSRELSRGLREAAADHTERTERDVGALRAEIAALTAQATETTAKLESMPSNHTLHGLVGEAVDERCASLARSLEARAAAAESAANAASAKGMDLEDELKRRVALIEAKSTRSASELNELAARAAVDGMAQLRADVADALDVRARGLAEELHEQRDASRAQLRLQLTQTLEENTDRLHRELAGIARSEAKRASPGVSPNSLAFDRRQVESLAQVAKDAAAAAERALMRASIAEERAAGAEARVAALSNEVETLRSELATKVSLMIQSSGRRMSMAIAEMAGAVPTSRTATAAAATEAHASATAGEGVIEESDGNDGEDEGAGTRERNSSVASSQSSEAALDGHRCATAVVGATAAEARAASVAATHAIADALASQESGPTLSDLRAELRAGLSQAEEAARSALRAHVARIEQEFARKEEVREVTRLARELEVLEHRVHATEDDVLGMATKEAIAEAAGAAAAAQTMADTALERAARAQETADGAPAIAEATILPKVDDARHEATQALREGSAEITASLRAAIDAAASGAREEAAAEAKQLAASIKEVREAAMAALEKHVGDRPMHGGSGGAPGSTHSERGTTLASKSKQSQFELKQLKSRQARARPGRPPPGGGLRPFLAGAGAEMGYDDADNRRAAGAQARPASAHPTTGARSRSPSHASRMSRAGGKLAHTQAQALALGARARPTSAITRSPAPPGTPRRRRLTAGPQRPLSDTSRGETKGTGNAPRTLADIDLTDGGPWEDEDAPSGQGSMRGPRVSGGGFRFDRFDDFKEASVAV